MNVKWNIKIEGKYLSSSLLLFILDVSHLKVTKLTVCLCGEVMLMLRAFEQYKNMNNKRKWTHHVQLQISL